jgi:1-acyl-sn-glycerol-3-phosphate acyltransferase
MTASWFYAFAKRTFAISFPLLTRLTVEFRAPLPDGPLIVMVNHSGFLDPALVNNSLKRRVTFLAKRELFEQSRVVRWLIEHYGGIPLNRGRLNRDPLRLAQTVLDQGGAIGVFPEGTRSHSGILQTGQRGAALLAVQADVPIVPVALIGTERLNRWYHLFLRPSIEVIVGESFVLPSSTGESRKIQISNATAMIMQRIASLLPENRRGVYLECVQTSY